MNRHTLMQGVYILNKIFEEYPEERYSQEHLEEVIKDYVAYESELLDWIYEKGQLSFYTKEDMLNFMKYRVDTAITHLNYNKIYNITGEQYSTMKWFDEDVFANELDDFLQKDLLPIQNMTRVSPKMFVFSRRLFINNNKI